MKLPISVVTLCALLSSSSAFQPLSGTSAVIRSTTRLYADTAEKVDYSNAERYVVDHPSNNVPPHIAALVGRGLHEKPDHPLGILCDKIKEYFAENLQLKENDLPSVCLGDSEIDLLSRISHMSESMLLEDFYRERGREELSAKFDCSLRTVERRLHLVRKKLSQRLTQE